MKSARPQKTGTSAKTGINYSASGELPPVVPALWPVAGTRADEALQAVLIGPQNQAEYGKSWRLAASIKTLEYAGWCFIKRDVTRPNCRRPITEYRIDRTDPRTAAALQARRSA